MNGQHYTITSATVAGNLTVRLTFNDGVVQTVDVGAFLRAHPHAQHNRYLDPVEFEKFRLVDGNIEWGRNADMTFPVEELHEGRISTDDAEQYDEALLAQLYGPTGSPERAKFDAGTRRQRLANEVGQKIILLRVEQGLTKKELAAKAGTSERTLSMVESGHPAPFATVCGILHALAPASAVDLGDAGHLSLQ